MCKLKMKTKNTKCSLLFIVLIYMFTSCQSTPNEFVVKSKSEDTYIDRINEAKDRENDGATNIASCQDINTTDYTNISEIINTKNNIVSVVFEADVVIPTTEKYPIFSIYPSKITQGQVDSFLNGFFPFRNELASNNIEMIPTKTEIEENILTLQSWIAMKELKENSEGSTNHEVWQEQINFLISQLDDAPEESVELPYDITKFSIIPLMEIFREEGTTIEEYYEQIERMSKNIKDNNTELINFSFKTEFGKNYEIYVLRSDKANINGFWLASSKNYINDYESYDDISENEITYKQATELAEKVLYYLGFDYMQLNYAAQSAFSANNSIQGHSYHFVYTRSIENVGITYTKNIINVNKLDYRPWKYEYFEIWIDDDGIQRIQHLSCPSIIGEMLTEDAPMIPVDEIIKKAKQYFSLGIICHSRNSGEYENMLINNRIETLYSNHIIIDKIVLGYMRVRQSTGQEEYILIPVWDFIGRESIHMDCKHKKLDRIYEVETEMPEYGYEDQHSFLTINAIDGSIIDRSLGY